MLLAYYLEDIDYHHHEMVALALAQQKLTLLHNHNFVVIDFN